MKTPKHRLHFLNGMVGFTGHGQRVQPTMQTPRTSFLGRRHRVQPRFPQHSVCAGRFVERQSCDGNVHSGLVARTIRFIRFLHSLRALLLSLRAHNCSRHAIGGTTQFQQKRGTLALSAPQGSLFCRVQFAASTHFFYADVAKIGKF